MTKRNAQKNTHRVIGRPFEKGNPGSGIAGPGRPKGETFQTVAKRCLAMTPWKAAETYPMFRKNFMTYTRGLDKNSTLTLREIMVGINALTAIGSTDGKEVDRMKDWSEPKNNPSGFGGSGVLTFKLVEVDGQ